MRRREFLAAWAVAGAAEITEHRRIWDAAPHNAFTDLVHHGGRWLVAFREGEKHVSADGALRVLSSRDGEAWTSAAHLTSPAADLRDPKFSLAPGGQLMLTAAGALHTPPPRHQTYAWYSRGGSAWSAPLAIGEPDFWLWRVTWHKGAAYSVGYHTAGANYVRLYRSGNGRSFNVLVERLYEAGFPNEATLRFDRRGTAVCLLRRERESKTALLGTARPPYTQWQWKDLGRQVGGPNLLQLPDGRWIAAGRLYDGQQRTSVCLLDVGAGQLSEVVKLPSNGDSSYPGLVWREGLLWVSYYSSHEGKSSIYLAKLKLG